ncbi:MAG: hypothetical protein V9H69_05525 [Anaerolineae bacterium]|jgi:phenylpyruvate tautomerase PptA (4-oxalocrotonate tautomerase family)
MNTPRSSHELAKWVGLVIVLMTLAVFLSLLSCLVLMAIPRTIDAVALRSLADQLGTEPSKAALVAHATELLENHKGSSREEVHQLLDDIGGFSYGWLVRMRNGESEENVNWKLAELPFGIQIWATWNLRYDSSDLLIEVTFIDS